jgi:hypothetical protein
VGQRAEQTLIFLAEQQAHQTLAVAQVLLEMVVAQAVVLLQHQTLPDQAFLTSVVVAAVRQITAILRALRVLVAGILIIKVAPEMELQTEVAVVVVVIQPVSVVLEEVVS